MQEYTQLQQKISNGWNTWNVRSIASHVRIAPPRKQDISDPDKEDSIGAFALNFCLHSRIDGGYLKEVLPGREEIRTGAHAMNGEYTDLTVHWNSIEARIETTQDDEDFLAIVTPSKNSDSSAVLVLEGGVLWNNPATVQKVGDGLVFNDGEQVINVHTSIPPIPIVNLPTQSAYLAMPFNHEIAICTGRRRSPAEIQAIIITKRAEQHKKRTAYGKHAPVYDAIQNAVGWNVIYEPSQAKAMICSSRLDSVNAGGWKTKSPDTCVASLLAALEDKELAYTSMIDLSESIVLESDKDSDSLPAVYPIGYIPSERSAHPSRSKALSFPPLVSFAALQLYKQFKDDWLLELIFDNLLAFNRWWSKRRNNDDFLAWKHDSDEVITESTMENSPLYDDASTDPKLSLYNVADIGLISLYILDCDCLAVIAETLRRPEAGGLRSRADKYRGIACKLWSEETASYSNRNLETDSLSTLVSPTGFYALLAKIPSPEQAEEILDSHLLNPNEFGGEFALPTLPRSSDRYRSGSPWQGAVSALANYLISVGLSYYNLPEAEASLAKSCEALLLNGWRSGRKIYEHYDSSTGDGISSQNFAPLSLIGAALGLVVLNAPVVEPPASPSA
jgi:hypothetical protein